MMHGWLSCGGLKRFDGDPAIIFAGQVQRAAGCFYMQLGFATHALFVNKTHEAARTVSTLPDFTAIGIVDAVTEVCLA